MNRQDLKEKDQKVYYGLLLHFPNVLNKHFPKRFYNNSENSKKMLEEVYFKKGIKPSKQKEHNIYAKFLNYTSPKSSSYDKKWKKSMFKKYPFLKEGKKERSFKKMLSLMPENVKFIKGQKWKGAKNKYWFICSKYGKFKRNASDLMVICWKKGLSGHPKDGFSKKYFKMKKNVKCLNNNKIYNSLNEISKKLKINRRGLIQVLKGKQNCVKGYRFVYV